MEQSLKLLTLMLGIMSIYAMPVPAESHLTGEYGRQVQSLKEHMKLEKIGTSRDFWLENNTAYGWEKVALIFGYGDDYSACDDIKRTLEAKYYEGLYRCIPANEN